MGADLYIPAMKTEFVKRAKTYFDRAVQKRDSCPRGSPESEAAQKAVEYWYNRMMPSTYYFRDSYNSTSLFHQLGLSWWRDVGALIDEAGKLGVANEDINLPPAFVSKLLSLVKSKGISSIKVSRETLGKYCTIDDGENSIKSWQEYFEKKYYQFVRFLTLAAKNNYGVYASI